MNMTTLPTLCIMRKLEWKVEKATIDHGSRMVPIAITLISFIIEENCLFLNFAIKY